MKKISLILLVAALCFVFMSTSLAAVSYDAESKTVTITSENTGFLEVWINGRNMGTMTGGSKTVSVAGFADGTYTVSLENSEGAQPGGGSFTIGTSATEAPATEAPATEPPATEAPVTAEPTAQPTLNPEEGDLTVTASYNNGVVSYNVHGLKSYAEIWLDGRATGNTMSSNGSGSFAAELVEGAHTLAVHVPATGETEYASFNVEYKAPVVNSVSYDKEGNLSFSVSNITNRCEVWLDGGSVGTTVSADGTYPLNKSLTHGSHTLTVYNPANNKSGSYTFTAHTYEKVAAVEPTCTEAGSTAGIKCSVCGDELQKAEAVDALDHDPKTVAGKAATCTEAGLTDGEVCSRCNTVLKAQEAIRALGHNYKVVDRSNGRIVYKCSRCGDSFSEKDPNYVAVSNKNALGNILMDTNNVYVDYTAEDNGQILVITADLSKGYTSEIGMYLTADLIAQIQKEGFTAIEYINGEADIVIELADIAATWFDTNSAIWCYVFSTDPAAENGTLVKVEAQISGTDKVPATAFTGVTLKAAAGDLAVTENGIY